MESRQVTPGKSDVFDREKGRENDVKRLSRDSVKERKRYPWSWVRNEGRALLSELSEEVLQSSTTLRGDTNENREGTP